MACLGLMVAWAVACGGTSEAQDSGETSQFAEVDCDHYNPVGIGSWGPENDLSEFRDAELLVKAEVTGHHPRTDIRLLNELKVLKVLKGDVAPGDQIFAGSAGGVCLPNGQVLYLFLTGPSPDSEDPGYDFVSDPATGQQWNVCYVRHPYAQFPIVDGRVEVYEGFLIPEQQGELPSRVNGLTEQELEQELREAIK